MKLVIETKGFDEVITSTETEEETLPLRLLLDNNMQRITIYEVLSDEEKRVILSIYRQYNYQSLSVVKVFDPFL